MIPQVHWNTIHRNKGERDVSWFEALPAVSLEMIEAAGLTPDTCVIDVGGGRSGLVDALLAKGARCLTVLDVSGEALRQTQRRLGADALRVTWIEADVTGTWSVLPMDIWHDRAMFHFLVDAGDRARYLAHLDAVLKPGGSAIIATFALDGPERCSGLPVVRYSPATLASELGDRFALLEARSHRHVTPSGAVQSFQYSRFRRAR